MQDPGDPGDFPFSQFESPETVSGPSGSSFYPGKKKFILQ